MASVLLGAGPRQGPEAPDDARRDQPLATPAQSTAGWGLFRRQHAVGPFVVDFFCARSKLAIEIDGETHASQSRYDAVRTRWLPEQKGLRVLRFANRDVPSNIEGVLYTINEAVHRPA